MHRYILVLALAGAAACGDNNFNSNTAPTVADLTVTTDEDTPLTRTFEVADAEGDDVTIAVTQPSHGTITMAGGGFTYTPAANYHGADAFTVTVSDGALEATATVAITVTPINDAPVGVADSFATNEDAPHEAELAALLANDSDVDGDTLTITSVGNATNGTVTLTATDVLFTPTANFTGSGSYRYTISDGTLTADVTVAITIGGVNDAPVATNDTGTTAEDTDFVVTGATLVANDTDAEAQTLTVTAVANATNGSVVLSSGTITFAPVANFNGTATFEYTVSDGSGTDTGTVTVTVTPVNDAPVALDDAASTNEDVPLALTGASLVANDTDVDTGTTLTVTGVANAVNGTVTLSGGDVTFTPAADANGSASFEYTVSDGTATDTGLVTVTVNAVNDPPVAGDDTAIAETATATSFPTSQFLANDTDLDSASLSIISVSGAQNGTVTLGTNTITFTSDAGFTGTASFDYEVSDGVASDTGTVTVNVIATNVCGDGFVLGNEQCDDDDTDPGDGCSATCTIETGFTCTGQPSVCTTICGDGIVAGIEACDDGANDPGDGCSAGCAIEAGFTCTGEPSVCTTICGDGILAGSEACDDDDTDPGDGCNASCGIESGFACTGQPSVCTTTCGDGIVAGTEQCDETNPTNGDGCDTNCTFSACGNGIAAGAEACDDGDADNTDGCTTQCVIGVVCNATDFAGADRFASDPATGTCYASFDGEQTTFSDAQTACVAAGGHLATTTSAGEHTLVTSVQNDAENPWIGAVDDANDTDAVFAWVTGEAFAFSAFAPNQPDDDVLDGGNGECLHLMNAAGEWNDTNCNIATFVVGRICEFAVDTCGDAIMQTANGEQCDDGNGVAGDGCNNTCSIETLVFSEYVEGSSNNKALEIRNPSATTAVDMTNCSVRLFTNGASTPSQSIALTQTIAANDVLVLCHASASAAILAQCDVQSSTVVNFNGDDAIDLVCNGTQVDVIGQIGFDPGTEWGTGLASTVDNTIRRKCSSLVGDGNGTNAFDPATEWVGFAVDTFSGLGSPDCAP